MDELLKRKIENKDYYNSEKRPVFWMEYDMLYVEILKNLVYNFSL
jgi:hypothetical protein